MNPRDGDVMARASKIEGIGLPEATTMTSSAAAGDRVLPGSWMR
jgi:hypothetical protein